MEIFGPFYGSLTVTGVQEDHSLLFAAAAVVVIVVPVVVVVVVAVGCRLRISYTEKRKK